MADADGELVEEAKGAEGLLMEEGAEKKEEVVLPVAGARIQ